MKPDTLSAVMRNAHTAKIHFIVGIGRSGTTLLMQLLNGSEQCLSTPENHFIMTFYGKYAHQKNIDPIQLAADIQQYYQNKKQNRASLHTWQYHLADFLYHIQHHSPKPLQYSYVCRAFLLSMHYLGQSNEQVTHIVDKEHDYSQYIPQLIALFPNAKFVVSIRDYRAVINSHQQSPNERISLPAPVALLWRNNYRYLSQQNKLYPDKFLFIRYEDIIVQQHETMQQICQFIGIQFEQQLLETHINMRHWLTQHQNHPEMTPRKAKKWNDLAQPINPKHGESWRQSLAPRTIALADCICAQTATHFGYTPIYQPNLMQRIFIYSKNLPQLIYALFAYLIFAKYYYRIPLSVRIKLVKYLKVKK